MHKVNINVHKLAWRLYIIKVALFGLIKKAFYTRGIWELGLAYAKKQWDAWHGYMDILQYISMDYSVINNFLFTKLLSPVNYGKKSVVDNIGPRCHKRMILNPNTIYIHPSTYSSNIFSTVTRSTIYMKLGNWSKS
jgi:hypothetical protein